MLNDIAPTISEEDFLGLTKINEASRISHEQGRRVETVEIINIGQKA